MVNAIFPNMPMKQHHMEVSKNNKFHEDFLLAGATLEQVFDDSLADDNFSSLFKSK